ncbi:Oligosaccharide translocation protein rft1 [Gnomoniopsis smithogilvyi]|uniref:Man(5)GlcNAc(2)-PP-dolichol translocation protein RFT1 n=1 Tax=Gnomoniopsis smithogilvyi TaxID=1191159 RepID=A0A9W8Z154_9PEZI|nr:Oligosaccharide translocation protein rft1 [Gnomoniopsis smithogilvyi]
MAASVLQGTSLLIALQFLSRAITFIANQLLLRFLTAQLLGVATHLEVYYLSVLFFARESLRVAIQRQGAVGGDDDGKKDGKANKSGNAQGTSKQDDEKKAEKSTSNAAATQAIINLGYLAPLLGAPIALLLGTAYTRNLAPTTLATTPYLRTSLHIYALAALLELLSEPAFVLTQSRLQLAARARAEGLATLAKCAVTLAAAVWSARAGVPLGALPFALGQTAFGVVLLGVYVYAAGSLGVVLPRRIVAGGKGYVLGWFYAPTLKLAATMWGQGLVKYFLTQGDSLLMGVLVGVDVQGVYALANNYGSLVARLVFQPVEESSRNYFSRLLSAGDVVDGEDATKASSNNVDTTTTTTEKTDNKDTKQPNAALTTASSTLTRLLRIYTLLTLPLLALGPPAAPLLLTLVAGPHWTAAGAGAALAAYIYYIPLLALNGLLEAFVASVAAERDVVAQSAWMAGFFAAFAGCAWVSLGVWGMGATGIVVANGVNMVLRIVWAVVFSKSWFAERGGQWSVRGALPGPGAVAAAAVAAQVVRSVVVSEAVVGVRDVLWELGKVAGVGVPFVVVLAFTERQFLIECYRTVTGRG